MTWKDPEIRKQKKREYYERDIEESRRKSRETNNRWKKRHPDKYLESAKKYRENHHVKVLEITRLWRKEHPQKSKELSKIWHQNNREKVNAEKREWRKNNPEKRRLIEINRLKRIQKAYNFETISKVGFALTIWSKKIRTEYNNLCQVCGKLAAHTHHILLKRFYPNLALNDNNGIPLCIECHKEVHGKLKVVEIPPLPSVDFARRGV